jgi:outer membrane protein
MKCLKTNRFCHLLFGILISYGLLSFSALASSSTPKDRQLQKLFSLALENSPIIQYSIEQESAARSNQDVVASFLKADVRFQSELSYSWMQKQSFARTASQLRATYPLYQPEREDLYSVASYQQREKKWQLEEVKQSLLLKVSNLYFNFWIQTSEQVFLQKEFDSISEIMEQVKQRFTIGYHDLNDISDIQARLDRNRADLIKIEQSLHIIQIDFELLLGAKVDLSQYDPPEAFVSAFDAVNSQQREQAEKHPAIMRYEQALLANAKKMDYEQNKDGIVLKAFGAVVNNQSDGYFYDDARGAKIGLKLDVPLYLGGQTESSVSKARAEHGQVLAQKRQQELLLATSLKRANENLKHNQKRLLALKDVLASNQQALAAAENGLTTGSRNILDLLDAQRSLHRAERDIQVVANNLWLNWYARLWSLGSIDSL